MVEFAVGDLYDEVASRNNGAVVNTDAFYECKYCPMFQASTFSTYFVLPLCVVPTQTIPSRNSHSLNDGVFRFLVHRYVILILAGCMQLLIGLHSKLFLNPLQYSYAQFVIYRRKPAKSLVCLAACSTILTSWVYKLSLEILFRCFPLLSL